MCGIAGIVAFDEKPLDSGLLLNMSQAIAHRGPDDEGYVLINRTRSTYRSYAGPVSTAGLKRQLPLLSRNESLAGADIGLCHRRFSIIDLSDAGHQPFFDRERCCCVVFNGEIYNYVELREKLASRGIVFQSQSDTEVLVEAYKHWGTDCFSMFNGFWAIALHDFRKKQLILSRDRIGKKPLYWTRVGSRIYFASEIKALFQAPEVYQTRKVNEESTYYWLCYGRRDLNSATCFDGIHSLPSASWAVVDERFPDAKRFWGVPKDRLQEDDISPAQAAASLRDMLQDSVRIRLRADVPVSMELSGGMDSSALVALAGRACHSRITTYTVRFPDKEWNEELYARSVARRCDTDYQVLNSPTGNFWRQILKFTRLEEEPYDSPNLQTSQVIWANMRSRGTKVALSGAGGDENLGGYGQYFSFFLTECLLKGRLFAYLSNALRYPAGRTHVKCLGLPVVSLAKHALLRAKSPHNGPWLKCFTGRRYSCEQLDPLTLSEALYSDMTNTLMPYWMRAGDRGYMGIPLEIRAPFLDYRVVEFAFRLPIGYLIRDGWQKWILRKAMEDLLPQDVVWRRQKMGFPFPYARFYRENQEIINLILKVSRNPYIDATKLGFPPGETSAHKWKIVSFLLWYELFFNENVPLFEQIEQLILSPKEDYGYVPQFLNSGACSS